MLCTPRATHSFNLRAYRKRAHCFRLRHYPALADLTPAQAAGLPLHLWKLADMVALPDTAESKILNLDHYHQIRVLTLRELAGTRFSEG